MSDQPLTKDRSRKPQKPSLTEDGVTQVAQGDIPWGVLTFGLGRLRQSWGRH
jgi:hypothetical protein